MYFARTAIIIGVCLH